jgi:hypothetical protein
LESLRRAQNPDGGWGYFPGKGSWLEPTVYAALALHGDPAADRAWKLLGSWQSKEGALRPSAEVELESWGTALWLTLGSARGESGEDVQRGVRWLLGVEGAESSWLRRVGASLGMFEPGRNMKLTGWPWKPDNSSWVEPTAHSLVALKKHAAKFGTNRLRERVRGGEAQLLDVRCSDGGWNYGSPQVLNGALPSYPETTGLALVGLQGHADAPANLGRSLDLAAKLVEGRTSPLARAWLTIALRVNGHKTVPGDPAGELPADLHEVALEALAAPEGNHQFFKTEAWG